ncbi:MAG: HEPN domain-containing protein [Nitrosopumilus sp.]|nr:HEPN domain-containing protein [Nitrosopumilus sp.]MDH3384927.1 HEPN domain-containing protein [Nitrosopumilus sp.]
MTLSDIENDLTTCIYHLNSTKTKGTLIESFLTQFLLVRICGQYEKEIERIVNERSQKFGDTDLAYFVKNTFQSHQHLKLDDIRGKILKKFNENMSIEFDSMIKNTEPEIRYRNIVTNRDAGAHGGTVNMTFDELILSHNQAKKVLEALSDVLK